MAKRPTAKKTPARRAVTASRGAGSRNALARGAGTSRVTIRHYCQGIGDCHLIRFRRERGGDFFMLIDCGVHSSVDGGSEKIAKIVADWQG
jgi:hypothetical protein